VTGQSVSEVNHFWKKDKAPAGWGGGGLTAEQESRGKEEQRNK